MTRSGARWSRWDWVGAVDARHRRRDRRRGVPRSPIASGTSATTFCKGRMLEYGIWAGGALAIGIGVVPAIARSRLARATEGRGRRPGVRALAIVTIAAVVVLRLLRGGQGRVPLDDLREPHARAEPRLPRAASLRRDSAVLRARGGRWWAVVAAGVFVLYLVRTTPYALDQYPNYEAHGLAILALANRDLPLARRARSSTRSSTVTIVSDRCSALVPRLRSGGSAAIRSRRRSRPRRSPGRDRRGLRGARREPLLQRLYATFRSPPNWLDRATREGR